MDILQMSMHTTDGGNFKNRFIRKNSDIEHCINGNLGKSSSCDPPFLCHILYLNILRTFVILFAKKNLHFPTLCPCGVVIRNGFISSGGKCKTLPEKIINP